jgi:cytoskeletal protein CcmA (bactofilin family)
MVRPAALFLACLALAAPAAAQDDQVRLGGHIEISEPVQGSLRAAGGSITIDAPIEGGASLAGGSIQVRGAVKEDLRAAGGHVKIDGEVGGDASIAAGTLELGPDARIAGKLSFHGGELKRDPAAVVGGGIERNRRGIRHHVYLDDHSSSSRYTRGWFWTAGLLVLAALIAAALPGPSQRMARELRERPWATTLVGLVALTTIPVAALLFLVTLIGIPIGLLAIASYAVLLVIGYVWLAVVMGGLLLDRVKPETAAVTAWRAGAAAVAMLALALLTRLPFIGGFIVFTALVVGVGMVVAVVMRRVNAADPAPTA